MTLTDLLRATQNQIYRQTHIYKLSDKAFERYLKRVKQVEQKSKSLLKVVQASTVEVAVDCSTIEVAENGFWVCEMQGDTIIFNNYVIRFQAERMAKNRSGAFVVEKVLPRPRMDKYDYQRELYRTANVIKSEYLKKFREDEGYVRQKDIVLVLNDHLRQQDFSARGTRLMLQQPKSLERVKELIKEKQAEGLLVGCEKYFKQRGKPYGVD